MDKKILLSAVCFISAFALFFGGCTSGKDVPDAAFNEAASETAEETEEEELVPLLASDSEHGIYLYGIKPRGVILYAHGEGHYYDWEYSPGSGVSPKIFTGSFRFGSEDDIAVVTCAENSGKYSEELRIITNGDFDEDGIYFVNSDEYNSYVKTEISYTYENETVTFSFDGRYYAFDVSESFDKLVFDGVSYSDSVSYELEDGKIYVNIVPYVRSADENGDYGSAAMDIVIRARLLFDGYNISLSDFSVKSTIGS